MLAVTVGVVVYGNVATVVLGESGDLARLAANLVFASIAVGVALRLGVGVRALGVDPRRPLRGSGLGVVVGLAVGIAFAALALIVGAATGEPIDEGVAAWSALELVVFVVFVFPLKTALPEELLFRGVLLALWARALSPLQALLVSSAAFGLWHLTVTWETAGAVEPGGFIVLRAGTYAVLLGGLAVAGALFGLLREASGGLAGPAIAHWLAVAPVRVAKWFSG